MLLRLVRRVTSNTRILLVVVLAAALVITVAGYAIGRGLGATNVPSGDVAVVEDAPNGTITDAQFQKTLQNTAAQQGLKKAPPPSDPQYATLRDAALSQAFLGVWVHGEAQERGITASETEISSQLQQAKKQAGGEKQLQQAAQQACPAAQDAHECVELQLISQEIEKQVLPKAPGISSSDIENFYEGNKVQFTQPETRDVRQIVNKDASQVEQAKQQLEADDSPDSWKKVAAKYSTDQATKSSGGLRQGVTQGQSEPAVDSAIFSAPTGQLVGPIKGQAGYYLIEVEKVTPEKITPLSDATSQIKQQLTQGIQQDVATAFQQDFVDKWTSRTFCAPDYVMNRCANFTPTDACNGDDPSEQGDIAKTGCPAFVQPMAPVAPGSGGLFPGQPAQGLPQGPQSGVAPSTSVIGPPGAPQLPPGAAPPGTAPPGTAPPGAAPPPSAPPPSAPPPGG